MKHVEFNFVAPFYLKMMRTNALRMTDEMWSTFLGSARMVTAGDVRWMLRAGTWRPIVMGAWFSLALPERSVTNDLVHAMRSSQGSLTAPPVATACALVADDSVQAMVEYIGSATNPLDDDASQAFVAAAVEFLGSDPPSQPSPDDRSDFRAMYELASRIRTELHG